MWVKTKMNYLNAPKIICTLLTDINEIINA